MKMDKIGIVGTGHIGGTLGILLAKAGYEIIYGSRHPETLKDLVRSAGPKACAGTVKEAIAFSDVIVVSVPLKALTEFDARTKDALKGKIVIDTSNPYPERDGVIAVEARKDPGGMGAFVSRLLPGARIIRAFNTVYFVDLRRTVNKNGESAYTRAMAGSTPYDALKIFLDTQGPRISGVGKHKLGRYGAAFLEAITGFAG